MNSTEIIKFIIALIVITNAFSAIPIFLSLTSTNTTFERKRIALKTGLSVAIIFTVVILIGSFVLSVFGISVSAFRVAGGVIIFLLGISMINSRQSGIKHTKQEQKHAEEKDDVAIVPLALPIIAGPGTISTLIIYSNQYSRFLDKFLMVGISLLVALFITVLLLFASRIGKYLGVSGIKIATRVMGMLLAALAIEMMANGVLELLPGLSN
ncbi:NAAT family transporter [Hyphobacterium sp. CCMP332]|nr:NAAT family transporter [Hyphobacterium sp. CCMP332]